MRCTRCAGICASGQFYDRVDEQGQMQLGAWRWALPGSLCGAMSRAGGLVGSVTADTSVPIDRSNSMPISEMF